MRVPKKILSGIRREKCILIATHINPDGDALGSAGALSAALESIGKDTFIYCRDPVPKSYRFLPGHDKFSPDIKNMLKADPMLILLDCNSPERASLDRYEFRTSVIIDHHETENEFGDIRWVDSKAAATGVMVFYLLKALDIKITKDIATNLYAAISVDTGTFRYSNTYAGVLRISADLIDAGAEPNRIADYLYERWDRKRFALLMMALNTLEIRRGVAMTHITKDMFRKTGAKPEDTENFSNFPRMIDSIKISAVFRDIGRGIWKVSLRSKGDVNVAKIAELYGGGGHKNAAGFRIRAGLKNAKESLLKTAKKSEVLSF
ncbi:MAG: bifunctional oligoribonuclease/PAP phosphatase NrnA [Nitrospirota bacterium]